MAGVVGSMESALKSMNLEKVLSVCVCYSVLSSIRVCVCVPFMCLLYTYKCVHIRMCVCVYLCILPMCVV